MPEEIFAGLFGNTRSVSQGHKSGYKIMTAISILVFYGSVLKGRDKPLYQYSPADILTLRPFGKQLYSLQGDTYSVIV